MQRKSCWKQEWGNNLYVPSRKVLRPDQDDCTIQEAGLEADAKLMLVASSAHDVQFVQTSRPDPLVKGFVEEDTVHSATGSSPLNVCHAWSCPLPLEQMSFGRKCVSGYFRP